MCGDLSARKFNSAQITPLSTTSGNQNAWSCAKYVKLGLQTRNKTEKLKREWDRLMLMTFYPQQKPKKKWEILQSNKVQEAESTRTIKIDHTAELDALYTITLKI